MERIKLETKHVSMAFPGVKALDDINFSVCTGEIHAIVGANGAGKSTLMKVLAGANPNYTGDVLLDGKALNLRTPFEAKKANIQIVYQEVDAALYPSLSVAENIAQNDMIMGVTGYRVNWPRIYQKGREALDNLHIDRKQINERNLVKDLSLAQKQMVLIAKALDAHCHFLILDEPTAPLSNTETEALFKVIRHLHSTANMAILFISHRLNEILEICENCTVMRNGKIVKTIPVEKTTTTKKIIELMLGRTFEENFPKVPCPIGETILTVKNLSDADDKIKDVSFYVRSGEIVGIAGLVGAGKSELCKTLFGAYRKSSGQVSLKGKELKIRTPSDAVKYRMALVPEERRKEGVLIQENVAFNLSAVCLPRFCRFSFINRNKVKQNAERFVASLNIVTSSIKQSVCNLSGGNQQKVAVGKWLAADCDIYIFDEPTKGVDVGAKQDIFRLINQIAREGNGVLYASCENSELLSLTDRLYVMYNGTVAAELETAKTTEDKIMYYAVGGGRQRK